MENVKIKNNRALIEIFTGSYMKHPIGFDEFILVRSAIKYSVWA